LITSSARLRSVGGTVRSSAFAVGGKLLWVAPVLALGYSRYMATAKNPNDTLAPSLRYQHKWIDEMRASARMRARLMKKIPKPVEFPRSLVEMTKSRRGAPPHGR
jgi:hypothetical protein